MEKNKIENYSIEELREMLAKREKEEAEKKKTEEEARAKKLKIEKQSRYDEIMKKEDELSTLIKSYIEDYGSFKFSTEDDYPLSRIWNRFFF